MVPVKVPCPCLGSILLLLLLPWLPPASGFFPNIWSLVAAPSSITHQDLTEEAALNVTLQLFLERPPPGRNPLRLEDFQGRTLLADDLFAAYFGLGTLSRRFRAALGEVARANAAQDFLSVTKHDPEMHFDSEQLVGSRAHLVGSLRQALSAASALEYPLARKHLGAMLHALQEQLDDPGPSSRPTQNISRSNLYSSTLGPQRGGSEGSMAAGLWWGPVIVLLLVFGIAAW